MQFQPAWTLIRGIHSYAWMEAATYVYIDCSNVMHWYLPRSGRFPRILQKLYLKLRYHLGKILSNYYRSSNMQLKRLNIYNYINYGSKNQAKCTVLTQFHPWMTSNHINRETTMKVYMKVQKVYIHHVHVPQPTPNPAGIYSCLDHMYTFM